jgi:hypothetical protein
MVRVRVIVFNAAFNNISAISCRSVFICGRNRSTRRKPPNLPQVTDKLYEMNIALFMYYFIECIIFRLGDSKKYLQKETF